MNIMQDTSPSKHLQVAIPDYFGSVTSPRTDSTSLSSKMKKILSSPKVKRGQSVISANKTFGVPLEFLYDRDKTNVPLIVTRICEYLNETGLRQEGLFRVNGNMKVVDRLKTAFDKCGDADLEEIGDVHAAASLLKMFLRELTEPVIPEDLQPLFISVQDKYCKEKQKAIPLFKELIKRMPVMHSALLKYLCEFMLSVTSASDVNKMTPQALAIVFGPNLFRCGNGLSGLRDQAYVNAVLLLTLEEFQELFLTDNAIFPDSISRTPPTKPVPYIEHMKMKKENTADKPTRPPPPHISLEDESISTDNSPKQSPKKESLRKQPKRRSPKSSPRQDNEKLHAPKKAHTSKEPTRSSSPVHMPSTPMSKQFVDTTINTAVHEHLFGPGLVTSSVESDIYDDSIPVKGTDVSHVYPSVKDRVKKFTVDKENDHNSPLKKMKSYDHQKEKVHAYNRSLTSPVDVKNDITDEDLDFMEESSSKTLTGLTASRVRPANRRKPSPRSSSFSAAVENFMDDADELVASERHNYSRKYQHQINGEWSGNQKRSRQQRSGVAPLLKSNSVPAPVSFEEMHKGKMKKSNSAEQLDVMSSIPPLDFNRLQDEEAHVSPREKYNMFFNEDPMPSPQNSAPSSPKTTPKRHEMWMEKRQDTVPTVEMSPQDLKKRIGSLKKIIANFESNFEDTNGRKPKPFEKNQIQKYIAELGRAKKQLKELISDYKEMPELLSETAPIGQDLGTAPNLRESLNHTEQPTKEQTLQNLLKKLEDKRLSSGRPQEMQVMTLEQLKDEKLSVQKILLQYENLHGRPNSKEDKALMRPLYDRYRKIKRRISTGGKGDSPSKQSETGSIFPDLSSTPKRIYDSRDNDDDNMEKNRRNNRVPLVAMTPINGKDDNNDKDDEFGDTFSVTRRFHDTPEPLSPTGDSPRSIDEAVLHDATITELLDQQRATKRVKKRLGKVLKEYEDDFYDRWNRRMQKEDRLPREAEYREYKLVKAKLRLVDALIAKKSANNTV